MNTMFIPRVAAITRILMGWLFFYAGYSKIANPEWTAAGYLSNATSFPDFYAWLALPGNIGWVNIVNEWGLLIVGILLLCGLFTQWAALGGIILMALYYFPVLNGYTVDHGIIVDDHIIYIAALALLIGLHAGRYFGLDKFIQHKEK